MVSAAKEPPRPIPSPRHHRTSLTQPPHVLSSPSTTIATSQQDVMTGSAFEHKRKSVPLSASVSASSSASSFPSTLEHDTGSPGRNDEHDEGGEDDEDEDESEDGDDDHDYDYEYDMDDDEYDEKGHKGEHDEKEEGEIDSSDEDETDATKTDLPFPLASAKRNSEFHLLFRSVPESDALIDDYKCALHRDILLQGHLYLSQHHVCFHANIFGWVTHLVVAYDEIISMEKRNTAIIIPNGIQISTAKAKHVFASLMSRDVTYDQMYRLWQMHHNAVTVLRALQTPDKMTQNENVELDDDDTASWWSALEDDSEDKADHPSPCMCADHYPVTILDRVYPGTVKTMTYLLFHPDFLVRALKAEGESFETSPWQDHMRESRYTTRQTRAACIRRDERLDRPKDGHATLRTTLTIENACMLCLLTCITDVSADDGARVRVTITLDVDLAAPEAVQQAAIAGQKRIAARVDALLRTQRAQRYLEQQQTKKQAISECKHDLLPLYTLCLIAAVLTHLLVAYRMGNVSNRIANFQHQQQSYQQQQQRPPATVDDQLATLNTQIHAITAQMDRIQFDIADQEKQLRQFATQG